MPFHYYEVYAQPDDSVNYAGGDIACWALPPSPGVTTFHRKPVPNGYTLLIAWEAQHYESTRFPASGIHFPPGYKEADPMWKPYYFQVTSFEPDYLFYWPTDYVVSRESDKREDVKLGKPAWEEQLELGNDDLNEVVFTDTRLHQFDEIYRRVYE